MNPKIFLLLAGVLSLSACGAPSETRAKLANNVSVYNPCAPQHLLSNVLLYNTHCSAVLITNNTRCRLDVSVVAPTITASLPVKIEQGAQQVVYLQNRTSDQYSSETQIVSVRGWGSTGYCGSYEQVYSISSSHKNSYTLTVGQGTLRQ